MDVRLRICRFPDMQPGCRNVISRNRSAFRLARYGNQLHVYRIRKVRVSVVRLLRRSRHSNRTLCHNYRQAVNLLCYIAALPRSNRDVPVVGIIDICYGRCLCRPVAISILVFDSNAFIGFACKCAHVLQEVSAAVIDTSAARSSQLNRGEIEVELDGVRRTLKSNLTRGFLFIEGVAGPIAQIHLGIPNGNYITAICKLVLPYIRTAWITHVLLLEIDLHVHRYRLALLNGGAPFGAKRQSVILGLVQQANDVDNLSGLINLISKLPAKEDLVLSCLGSTGNYQVPFERNAVLGRIGRRRARNVVHVIANVV